MSDVDELVAFLRARNVNRKGEFERRATEAADLIAALRARVAALEAESIRHQIECSRMAKYAEARIAALEEEISTLLVNGHHPLEDERRARALLTKTP